MFEGKIIAHDAPPVSPAAFRQRMLIETGNKYGAFRKSLTPRYARILAEIGLGYAALAGLIALVGQAHGIVAGLAAASLGALAVGYVVAFLQLFIHEGAHLNLASSRTANDRIADWLICWQVGTSIAAYRANHSEHHRHLGKAGDTEVSYRHPLTLRFVVEMLTGFHALRVFSQRKATAAAKTYGAAAVDRRPLIRGLALHGAILALLLVLGVWPAMLAWIGGIAIAFPFFATVRQLLEHRPAPAMADEGDAVTRLFGDGVIASTFGGAGFNRHLLHHLEPQVSYTRLRDLERFLMSTSMRPYLDARRSTYFETFAQLLREAR